MSRKYALIALSALIPAVILSGCASDAAGISSEKKVGNATCQDYYNAIIDLESDSSKDLLEKLHKDTGVDPNNSTQADELTYQMMDYCGIDVQSFLKGGDIQLEDSDKKLADFSYVRPTSN